MTTPRETETVPREIRTARLLLRSWRAEDAGDLRPVLESNQDHLNPWIPTRVSEPAPLPVLMQRLADNAAEFHADQKWRYGMFSPDGREILGEVDLFPRNATGRVSYPDADRAEIGYWLRRDRTGQGLVSEAVRAMFDLTLKLPRINCLEIRCDARNLPSAAIPRRFGFVLSNPAAGSRSSPPEDDLQIWVLYRHDVEKLMAAPT